MFVYMGEWGWQGYNLLQTACGQRRGGRDSDTEREQGKGGSQGRVGAEDTQGRNELAREKKKKKKYRMAGKKARREGGGRRGEVRAEWIRTAY